jgi:hypothetical protein
VTAQAGGVSVTFPSVSTGGQTTVIPIPAGSAGSVPGGFQIDGLGYEISTTANFTPPVSVCFTVSAEIAGSQTQFNALSLMHNENGVLVDRTTSRNFPTRQICGSVNSLSPFALAEQIDASKPKLSGLALDSNGKPLSGVKILLTGAEQKQTVTDASGSFTFVNLTLGGNYNVQPNQGADEDLAF